MIATVLIGVFIILKSNFVYVVGRKIPGFLAVASSERRVSGQKIENIQRSTSKESLARLRMGQGWRGSLNHRQPGLSKVEILAPGERVWERERAPAPLRFRLR
jgi:hypothetical protein